MPFGFLARDPTLPRSEAAFGRPLRPDLPTRFEEFRLAREALRSVPHGTLLDAACGFEPGVHIFPEIAASDGWTVEAVDLRAPEPASTFPGTSFEDFPNLHRRQHDLQTLPYEDSHFDAAVCISALEHFPAVGRGRALMELWRVVKPGGLLLITMDEAQPQDYLTFYKGLVDFGNEVPLQGESLSPRVMYLIGTVLKKP